VPPRPRLSIVSVVTPEFDQTSRVEDPFKRIAASTLGNVPIAIFPPVKVASPAIERSPKDEMLLLVLWKYMVPLDAWDVETRWRAPAEVVDPVIVFELLAEAEVPPKLMLPPESTVKCAVPLSWIWKRLPEANEFAVFKVKPVPPEATPDRIEPVEVWIPPEISNFAFVGVVVPIPKLPVPRLKKACSPVRPGSLIRALEVAAPPRRRSSVMLSADIAPLLRCQKLDVAVETSIQESCPAAFEERT